MRSQNGVGRSSTALDVLGGARYWNQELDLSLAVDASVDFGNLGLKRSGSRAVARSGALEWSTPSWDCAFDTNWRREKLQFLGDVGGFGVGSDFTWQLFGGYSFDFAVWQTTLTVSWAIARWLSTTHKIVQNKNNLDLVLHGPVVGLSFRW